MPQPDSRWRQSDIPFVLSVSIACQRALKRFHEERALYLSRSEARRAEVKGDHLYNVLVEKQTSVRLSGYEKEEDHDDVDAEPQDCITCLSHWRACFTNNRKISNFYQIKNILDMIH